MTKENTANVKHALSIYKKALSEAEIEDTLDCWLCEKYSADEMLDQIKSGHKITCIRCEIIVEAEIEYLEGLLPQP